MTLRRTGEFAAVSLLLAILLCMFADGDGYEGDDLNSIVPMLYLAEARAGDFAIYRYDWQPLSYQFGAALVKAFGVRMAFWIAPLSLALGLACIAMLLRRRGVGWAYIAAFVLMAPELLFTGLYYNSTALALACLAAAIWLTAAPSIGRLLLAGVLIGAAGLFRLDTLAIATLIAAWSHLNGARIAGVVLMAGASVLTLLAAIVGGLFSIEGAIEIYSASAAEVVARSDDPGWDQRAKLLIATMIFSPMGWVYFLIGGAWALVRATSTERRRFALLMIAALPALAPLPDLLSVKYLTPLLLFAPLLAAEIWRLRPEWRIPPLAPLLFAGTAMTAVVAAALPPVWITAWPSSDRPREMIRTHDGDRAWGAQIGAIANLHDEQARPAAFSHAQAFLALHAERGGDIAIIGEEDLWLKGGSAWRHMAFQLAADGVAPRVESAGRVVFQTQRGSIRLFTPESAARSAQSVGCVIDLTWETSTRLLDGPCS
ncbi:MAG: hypothetical protein AAF401_05055 [Pseudomonadota bacterium]